MLGVVLRLLRRPPLAEEAVQDTFVQVWKRAASFDPARGGACTCLYAVLRHRALNILRGEARTDHVDNFEPMEIASEEENAEHLICRRPKPARCAAASKGSNHPAVRPSCLPTCMG